MTGPRLGVLGWPVAHSLSPRIHNAALAEVGLGDWRYQLLPVPPELFGETVQALPAAGFVGASVTVPHKEAALAVADEAGEAARAIGAANTLLFGEDGRISAQNTDAPGFIAALGSRPQEGSSALVLGAGGSARAVAWALAQCGVVVRVWNRNPSRAAALAADLGVEAVEVVEPADLLVNCTAAGMDGDPLADLPVDEAALAGFVTVADLVYADPDGRLLAAAARAGARTVDGLAVLVAQGAIAFEMWTGRPAPEAAMTAAARAAAA